MRKSEVALRHDSDSAGQENADDCGNHPARVSSSWVPPAVLRGASDGTRTMPADNFAGYRPKPRDRSPDAEENFESIYPGFQVRSGFLLSPFVTCSSVFLDVLFFISCL